LNNPINPDFMINAQGHHVPLSKVKPIDIERNDLVLNLVTIAKGVRQILADFKADAFGDIGAFVQLSAEQYGVKVGGQKGNIVLHSFDGKYKIARQIAEHIQFDERLQAAKALIDQCINNWTTDSNDNVKAIINKAFEVNKEGHISTSRVLALRTLNIDDIDWKNAMSAIADSITIVGSKAYIRLYERVGDTDQWSPISLDIASLQPPTPRSNIA
jgi:hypothetical protein